MKKYLIDMTVVENAHPHPEYCVLKLTAGRKLPEMIPGQFVQVRVDGSPHTFLRRPVSVNYVDRQANELWLLIRIVGEGTRRMSEYQAGDVVNVMLPLGNGFSVPQIPSSSNLLLIGGGVGTAPMLYFGDTLKSIGFNPEFLLGARSKDDVMQLPEFEKTGVTYVTTEDGSLGEKGFVTNHTVLAAKKFDRVYACGPEPMMRAVARYAKAAGISCDVSLENTMACGMGACLCCVEKTVKGNVCVCTEGPVFNINQLTWQI
ncbi:MAG: dihydroorotate dehydrogenase electron transfer subunit [Tannerella sp.]|nr:dihydroorotate dehydrogenase electron transfer subunit [Tannerella sp.]